MSEYTFHHDHIAPLLFEYGNTPSLTTKIFTRNFGGVSGAYKNINAWAESNIKNGMLNNACVELHFNAFNSKVAGTETLYDLEPKQSAILADHIQEKLCQALKRPGKSRGSKLVQEGRGAYNLQLCKIPGVLTEIAFCDNPDEARLVWNLRHEYARYLISGVNEYFKDTI